MLLNEARWIGERLKQISNEGLSPVLNVGSGTADFREHVQPWIEEVIFRELQRRGAEVRHTDLQGGAGIDFSGDLDDDSFFNVLRTRQYKVLLCCNLLEHVRNPLGICEKLEGLVADDGHIVVTVPRAFPYHPDPIDTMLRPTPAEIASMFPNCGLVQGDIISCGSGWDYVGGSLLIMIQKLKRRLAVRHEHGGMKGSTSFAPWLFRQFLQTCVLLRKRSGAGEDSSVRASRM